MAKSLRLPLALLAALVLLSHRTLAQEDEDDMYGGDGDEDDVYGDGPDGMDGDGDYGGHGGGGGELKELSSVEDFEQFINHTDASIVFACTAEKLKDPKAVKPEQWDDDEDGDWDAPTIDNPSLVTYKAIAGSEYGYRFAWSTASTVLERLKSKTGGLYLYRSPYYLSKEHGDRPRERYPGDSLSEGAVSDWIGKKAQTLVGEYSSSSTERYKGPTLVIFLNLDWESNSKSINYVLKRARKVAVGLKDKLSFAVASITALDYELDDYGLKKKENSDILMGIRAGPDYDAAKYGATDKSFSAEALKEFADAYIAGKLKPYKRDDDASDNKATEEL